jgi:aspartyl/asparaginyl beta-hydroxylase
LDIESPLRDLGDVDPTALQRAILAAEDDEWLANQLRQSRFDVHYKTQSLIMIFTETEDWPRAHISRDSGWDRLAPAAQPLMEQILAQHYPPGGRIIRAIAAKLTPGSVIKPHRDAHPSFHAGHRIHIPITTNPRVRFTVDGGPCIMQIGRAYEINNQLQHSVMNRGTEDRIHFIFDYIPPSQLETLSIEGDPWTHPAQS